jgi:hypothetical protein
MADKIVPFPTRWAGPSEPNIQNIPIRTAEGRKIRDAFTKSGSNPNTVITDGLTPEATFYGKPNPVDVTKMIFVFGSNEAGVHGAGAARLAYQRRGAILGQGYGLQGNSFGIPTKGKTIKTLPLNSIAAYVHSFLAFAKEHPELDFQVTAVGCGLAGLQHRDIAPMFRLNRADTLPNLYFDEVWRPFLCVEAKFWGTF